MVDENDVPVGREEKTRCHLPDGRLHRAFTALIFDNAGRLLLTRRSPDKMLWPGHWDGTVASHPREGETYASSAYRRMPEELGITCTMDYMFKFEYHVPYMDVGSENEICGTLVGTAGMDTNLHPAPGEIDSVRWASPQELLGAICEEPKSYCPWMLIAKDLRPRSDPDMLKKHAAMLDGWTGMQDSLVGAIRAHLPDDQWRPR